jgi:hypothetical protein
MPSDLTISFNRDFFFRSIKSTGFERAKISSP